ncbi:unnamed protein product [Linum trigynum]|uniref:Uncharacterized protein n=1 Tax=Linum trigynum TaxID=586398 RepID=A0AAV2FLT2_9ROSI
MKAVEVEVEEVATAVVEAVGMAKAEVTKEVAMMGTVATTAVEVKEPIEEVAMVEAAIFERLKRERRKKGESN